MSFPNRQEKNAIMADPISFMERSGTDFSGLPWQQREGFALWWCFGVYPGPFLRAVVENDLFAAVTNADKQSLMDLRPIVLWVYAEDSRCLAGRSKSWAEAGGCFGKIKEADFSNAR